MAVETSASGELPQIVRLPQTGVYTGASDLPAPAIDHFYVRADDVAGWATYQYGPSSEPQ